MTILAFIFLPVSLASSIFGMNVQQINSTRSSIRAFVVNAIILLVLASGLWAISAIYLRVHANYKQDRIERVKAEGLWEAGHFIAYEPSDLTFCGAAAFHLERRRYAIL